MAEPDTRLPDGLVAVVKRDCPTCLLVAPVLGEIVAHALPLTVCTQDDPSFPQTVPARVDDETLAVSWHHRIQTVPTLLRVEDGVEVARTEGWSRAEWEALARVRPLGDGLPPFRPGCGSLSADPARADALRERFAGGSLRSRRIELAPLDDEMETAHDRGWTDGLPVVPPRPPRASRSSA